MQPDLEILYMIMWQTKRPLATKGVDNMQGNFAMATIILMMVLILLRVVLMRKVGIEVMRFAETDKKDFLLPPFAFLYFYLVFASALNLPKFGVELFSNEVIGWIGVVLCILGLIFILLSLISFGKSFRIGIDMDKPDALVTTGAFAISRNPLYTSFAIILFGIFLIFPNWVLLMYFFAGIWAFNRQVLREEASLRRIYGEEYEKYCKNVRRYL
ncbi:MAG: isoprenylcysteine carboxylmethyltransferase family protein [Syntrophaceticus sp.]|nr:isoprenylcysteine carboxylmethyltransferase family protein [Syntrophaceticus sp.]